MTASYTEATVETVARILDAAHRRDHSWHDFTWRDFAGDARDVLDALTAAGWRATIPCPCGCPMRWVPPPPPGHPPDRPRRPGGARRG